MSKKHQCVNIPCKDCGWEPEKRIRRKRFSSNAVATRVLGELCDLISKEPWFVSLGMNPDTIIVEVNDEQKAWGCDVLNELFQGYTVMTVLESKRLPKVA